MQTRIYTFFAVFVLALSISNPARADMDFIQKLQNIYKTVEENAKTFQEKVQKIKDMAKSASEGVSGVAEDIKSGVEAARNMDPEGLKEFGKRVEGLPTQANASKDEMAKAVEDVYIPKVGEGNDSEVHDEAQKFMQEVLRNAVSRLYALGFTTRTQMQKEEVRDVDMKDTRKMMQETNNKAIEVIERMAQIYMLESAMEEYKYTLSLRSMKIDASEDGEE